MTRSQTLLVAEVQLKEENGSILAYSDELPGLNIVGTDRETVLADVLTGIKFLYKELHGMAIDASWVDSPASVTFKKDRPAERVMMQPAFA
jgi:hypothetical protein